MLIAGLRGRARARARRAARVPSPAAGGRRDVVQLGAWGLQWMSCWLLLMALGLATRRRRRGGGGAVRGQRHRGACPRPRRTSASSRPPASPCSPAPTTCRCPTRSPTASSCRRSRSPPRVMMGVPALVNEGLSWRDVRLRTMHAAPVTLQPLSADGAAAPARVAAQALSATRRRTAVGRAGSTCCAAAMARSTPAGPSICAASGHSRGGHGEPLHRQSPARDARARAADGGSLERAAARRRGSSGSTRAAKLALVAGRRRRRAPPQR